MKTNTQIVILIAGLLFCFQSFSQDFGFTAGIETHSAKGFYKIALTPEIVSKLKNDGSDIRIFDESGTEVPYIYKVEIPYTRTQLFKEYEILSKEHKFSYSRIVLQNAEKKTIDQFVLIIRNNDVHKWLTLNGSDDNKKWFAVKDNYSYWALNNNDETYEVRIMDFPKTNYKYYEILIEDYFNEPIDVLKVGYYDTAIEKGKYSELPAPVISQNDSMEIKTSFVHFKFNEKQYIDKIGFKIEGPAFYYRKAALYIPTVDPKSKQATLSFVSSLELSSNGSNVFYLNNLGTDELVLEINNEDNPPLKITTAIAQQLNHYLVSYLDEGKKYNLQFSDKNAKSPVYDLGHFTDSIPGNTPVLNVAAISANEKEKAEQAFYMKPVFLWAIIGVVLVFLGFMSFRMLKEMKKEK